MFTTIGITLAGLFGKTITADSKAAKVIGWIAAGALLLAVLSIGKCAYDASVIDDHERDIKADINEGLLEGERKANADKAERDTEFDKSASDIAKGVEDAKQADPEGAARPVGPVSQSYYDRLRDNQDRQAR